MEILRPEINHLTQQEVPEEYQNGRTRVQLDPFYADGFRANLHELMYKGNYALYSVANIVEAVMLMGANQQQVNFNTAAKYLSFKQIRFKKMSTTTAYMEFPNIVGDTQFSYIKNVTVKSGSSSTVITGVNNSMFIGDFTSADFNDTTTVDVEVTLSATSPIGLIGDITVDTGNYDLNNALKEWLEATVPMSALAKYNNPSFLFGKEILFSQASPSVTPGYISSSDFEIWASDDDITINGVNGTTHQFLNNGEPLVFEDLVGRTVNSIVIVSVSGVMFQFQTGWRNRTPDWTLRPTMEVDENSGMLNVTVTSDIPWRINYVPLVGDSFIFYTPRSMDAEHIAENTECQVVLQYTALPADTGDHNMRSGKLQLLGMDGTLYYECTVTQTRTAYIETDFRYHLSTYAVAPIENQSPSVIVAGGSFKIIDQNNDNWFLVGVAALPVEGEVFVRTNRYTLLWRPYTITDPYAISRFRVSTDGESRSDRHFVGAVDDINAEGWSTYSDEFHPEETYYVHADFEPMPVDRNVTYRFSGGSPRTLCTTICNEDILTGHGSPEQMIGSIRLRPGSDDYHYSSLMNKNIALVFMHYHTGDEDNKRYRVVYGSGACETYGPDEYAETIFHADLVEKWWDTSTNDPDDPDNV